MSGMPTCENCIFYKPETFTDPWDKSECPRVIRTMVCTAGPEDDCPIEARDRKIAALEAGEVVAPCPKCGRDCDGYPVVDGIQMCPDCDADLIDY